MLRQRQGLPEEGELVWCKVTKVQYHSVFCHLEEYDKSGMIHISEVSPGRIRNIRDYVQEGKLIVCKILRINQDRGHIDLSLRRVSEGQRRQKANAIKQEQKAEKILESFAKTHKKKPLEVYADIKPLFEHYEYLFEAFEDLIEQEQSLAKVGVPAALAKDLDALVKERIAPKQVVVQGNISLQSYAPNGVQIIREALALLEKTEAMTVRYVGAGHFRVSVTAKDYKKAEKVLDENVKAVITYAEKHEGTGSFDRKEK